LKRVVWSLIPVLVLLLAGEVVVRLRYFYMHKYDWYYITMPWKFTDTQNLNHAFFKLPEKALADAAAAAAAKAPAAAAGSTTVPAAPAVATPTAAATSDATPAATPSGSDASADQMKFKWVRPCRDREVFSLHYQKPMPYTWDANCFRGDTVTTFKPAGELRVFVVGGSTVEDAQPDIDMWTRQLKNNLNDPRVKVINAGQTAMGSGKMTEMYESRLSLFKPDLLLYYEAWNEQTDFGQLPQIEERLAAVTNRFHKALHYRSLLYTYLVEKYSFATTTDVKFWKIDVKRLQDNLERLQRVVKHSGARFVFITQAIRLPRHWKGVDTFDPNAVDALLDRLKNDSSYVYDTEEISSLNQRLAVFRSIERFKTLDIPVINILDEMEALGVDGRKPMFVDLGHLTWQGDHLVGKLVAEKLAALGILSSM